MGTLLLKQIKKQTSSFLQEKFKIARLALTDVTRAELLAEEVTNGEPCTPDAKTMTIIAEASFDVHDYWRIVFVIHKRLNSVDWKQWRQSYKTLVLLEFLLTHGPEDFAEEFQCDMEVIEELGSFTYIDERGFNWGASMLNKSDRIIKLLEEKETLREERLKAIKLTKEIQGFGSSSVLMPFSPSSSSEHSPSSSSSEVPSTFGSFSSSSPPFHDMIELNRKLQLVSKDIPESDSNGGITHDHSIILQQEKSDSDEHEGRHMWVRPAIEEEGSLIDFGDHEEHEKTEGLIKGICSKLVGCSPSRGNGEK